MMQKPLYPAKTHAPSHIPPSVLRGKTLRAIEKTLYAFYDYDEEELTESQKHALQQLQEVYGKLIQT